MKTEAKRWIGCFINTIENDPQQPVKECLGLYRYCSYDGCRVYTRPSSFTFHHRDRGERGFDLERGDASFCRRAAVRFKRALSLGKPMGAASGPEEGGAGESGTREPVSGGGD